MEKLNAIIPRLIDAYQDNPKAFAELSVLRELDLRTADGLKIAAKRYRFACWAVRDELIASTVKLRQNASLLELFWKNGSEKGIARCLENVRSLADEIESERRRFFELVSYYDVFGVKRGSIFTVERGRQTGGTKAIYDAFVKDARAFLDGEISTPPEWPFGKKAE